jgi:hypothetical protein
VVYPKVEYRPVTVGAPYPKLSPRVVPEVPAGVETVMSTAVPVDPAGEVAVMVVGDATVTELAATLPKSTVAPGTNPDPVMVTEVRPAAEPASGLSEDTTGIP